MTVEPITLKNLVRMWVDIDQVRNKQRRRVLKDLNRLVLCEIGHMDVRDIRRSTIMRVLDKVAVDRPVMANRLFAYLRRCFMWSYEREIIPTDPLFAARRPAKERPRQRVLDDLELSMLWWASDSDLLRSDIGDLFKLLVLTGCRRSEIGGLRFHEVKFFEDKNKAHIHLPASRDKTGNERRIPLVETARKIVAKRMKIALENEGYLFGRGKGGFGAYSSGKRQLDIIVARLFKCTIPDWTLHDIRRTVATGLQKLGVKLEVTEAVLGHRSGSRSGIVAVYQTYGYEKEKREALREWENHVLSICQEVPPLQNHKYTRRCPEGSSRRRSRTE